MLSAPVSASTSLIARPFISSRENAVGDSSRRPDRGPDAGMASDFVEIMQGDTRSSTERDGLGQVHRDEPRSPDDPTIEKDGDLALSESNDTLPFPGVRLPEHSAEPSERSPETVFPPDLGATTAREEILRPDGQTASKTHEASDQDIAMPVADHLLSPRQATSARSADQFGGDRAKGIETDHAGLGRFAFAPGAIPESERAATNLSTASEAQAVPSGDGALTDSQAEILGISPAQPSPAGAPTSDSMRKRQDGGTPPAVQTSGVNATGPAQAVAPVLPSVAPLSSSDPLLRPLDKAAANTLDARLETDTATVRFDLRGDDTLASRQMRNPAVLHPDMPRHMAIQLATAAQNGQPDRPVLLLLNPEELGHVRIHITSTEGMVNMSVVAERPETLDLMRRHIETLAQEFQKIGYHHAEFSFGGGQSSSDNAPASRPEPREKGDTPFHVASVPSPNHAGQVISDRLDLRL